VNTQENTMLYLVERLGLPSALVVMVLAALWWFIRGPLTSFLSRIGDVVTEAGRALVSHLAAQTQELRRIPEYHEHTRDTVREEGTETREALRAETGALFTELQGAVGKLEQVLERLQREVPHAHCGCPHAKERSA
jgi:hypothetical protein